MSTLATLYDANCGVYNYNDAADSVNCNTCKAKYYKLTNVVGGDDGDLFTFCFKEKIDGCTAYATTAAERTDAMA